MNLHLSRLAHADKVWLDATFARNRARFGDLRMEGADDKSADQRQDDSATTDTQPDADDQSPKAGPNGYPENMPWRDMEPGQQVAYWQHKAKSHESGKKAALTELSTLKPKAEQFDALDQASQDEKDRQIATLNKQIEDANKARQTEREKHGAELVQARLAAAADKKGMTSEALLTLAGKPDRFFGDDGVDTEAIDDFLAALPDKESGHGSSGARDLGGGKRTTSPMTPTERGRALLDEVRGKKKSTPA